jgi:hypothetical protein
MGKFFCLNLEAESFRLFLAPHLPRHGDYRRSGNLQEQDLEVSRWSQTAFDGTNGIQPLPW